MGADAVQAPDEAEDADDEVDDDEDDGVVDEQDDEGDGVLSWLPFCCELRRVDEFG